MDRVRQCTGQFALAPHRGINEKGIRMLRMSPILFFVGAILVCQTADAQCRGASTGQTTTGTTTATGTTAAGLAATGNLVGTSRLLNGPGSLAFDMMMAQMMAQQVAQRQAMLAMEQQRLKQEKLAQRRYRAEQTRTQVAESRARTRAALTAKNGLAPATSQTRALVAYQPARR